MRTFAFLFVLLFTSLAWSQPPQYDQEQLQRMMQHAAEMQACFAQVDQQQLQALAEKAQRAEADIKALCQQGERAKAKTAAIEFGKALANSAEMQDLRKCGEIVRDMIPSLLTDSASQSGDIAEEAKHVCEMI